MFVIVVIKRRNIQIMNTHHPPRSTVISSVSVVN